MILCKTWSRKSSEMVSGESFFGHFGAWSRKSSEIVSGGSFFSGFGAWSRKSSEMVSGGSFLMVLELGRESRLK